MVVETTVSRFAQPGGDCPHCGSSKHLVKLTRHRAPTAYLVGQTQIDCPACRQPALDISMNAHLSWRDEFPENATMFARVVTLDPVPQVISGSTLYDVANESSLPLHRWGDCRGEPFAHSVHWLAELVDFQPDITRLRVLEVDLDGVPWLRFDLVQMRRAFEEDFRTGWPVWQRLVEPLLDGMLRAQWEESLQSGTLRVSLGPPDVPGLVHTLCEAGFTGCPLIEVWSAGDRSWHRWSQCALTYETPRETHRLEGSWSAKRGKSAPLITRVAWHGPSNVEIGCVDCPLEPHQLAELIKKYPDLGGTPQQLLRWVKQLEKASSDFPETIEQGLKKARKRCPEARLLLAQRDLARTIESCRVEISRLPEELPGTHFLRGRLAGSQAEANRWFRAGVEQGCPDCERWLGRESTP